VISNDLKIKMKKNQDINNYTFKLLPLPSNFQAI
jgi:hypothetical protein